MPDLTTMFPAEILPEDYGGKEKPLSQLHGTDYRDSNWRVCLKNYSSPIL